MAKVRRRLTRRPSGSIPTIGASFGCASECNLKHGKRDKPVCVSLQAVPLTAPVEGCRCKRQPRLQPRSHPMPHPLQAVGVRQHGKHSLDQHRVFVLFDQRLEHGIVNIGGVYVPIYHAPQVVEDKAQLSPNDPAVVGLALTADLLVAAPRAPGVNDFDAEAVHDAQKRRLCQKALRPARVRRQQAKEACSLACSFRQVWPQPNGKRRGCRRL
jgi:hypothetical protein